MKFYSSAFAALIFSLNSYGAEPPLPEPIQALERQGFELKKQFTAPSGLPAYAMAFQGQGTTVYLTPDKQHAIVGNMIDKAGKNISEEIVEQYIYAPLAQQMWGRLAEQQWIGIGKKEAPHIVYMFADPYCPYCSAFWQQAQPWITAGKVQLRVLLVAMLKPESRLTAAALLMAKDPTAALTAYENSHGKTVPNTPDKPDTRVLKALQDNLDLMDSLGGQATPSIYYLNPQGRLQQHQGKPDDESLRQIMGDVPDPD